jgi:hypothetical protein
MHRMKAHWKWLASTARQRIVFTEFATERLIEIAMSRRSGVDTSYGRPKEGEGVRQKGVRMATLRSPGLCMLHRLCGMGIGLPRPFRRMIAADDPTTRVEREGRAKEHICRRAIKGPQKPSSTLRYYHFMAQGVAWGQGLSAISIPSWKRLSFQNESLT